MAIVVTEESETPPSLQLVERMAFGWWNTSLSPIGKNRADDHHKEIAAKVVKSLIDDFRIDCLGLGEVTNTDLSSMMDACDTKTLGVYEGTLKRGRLQFDTGVIYNIARLAIADSFSTVSTHGERNYKIANRIDFVSLSDGLPLHFFVSHWPSRGTNEETLLSRKTIATRLKDQINAIDERSPGAAAIFITPFGDNWENHNLTRRHFRSVARLGAVFIRARRTRDGELTIKYLYRPPFSAIPIGI